MKSKILVFIQFFIIFLMLLPLGNEVKYIEIGTFFIVVGSIVGVLALVKNKIGNFNIRPDIKEGCFLITDGIYKYVRHPMYSSVLLMMLGIMFLYMHLFEVVLYTLLVIDLIVKMLYEENLWCDNSEEYIAYSKKTKRLIPYVF